MAPERLDSWKEIADYLGKGVSTVRRWERDEGLPVHRQEHLKRGSVIAFKPEIDAWLAARTIAPAEAVAPVERWRPSRRVWLTSGLLFGGAAMWMGWKNMERPLRLRNLGEAREPSLSPDGKRVALLRPDRRVAILDLVSGKETPVAVADAPRWSHDGKLLAYAKKSGAGTYAVAVCGENGLGERIVRPETGPFLDWMADNEHLVVSHREDPAEPMGAYSLRIRDGHLRRLTHPPRGTWGDIMLTASPRDRNLLALVRYADRGHGDIYLSRMDGSETARLTTVDNWINGLAFSPDGTEVVFSSEVNGFETLYRIPRTGGEVRRVAGAPGGAQWPSFAVGMPGRLCFHECHWETPLVTAPAADAKDPRWLFRTSEPKLEAIQVSRNGQWISAVRFSERLLLLATDESVRRTVFEGSNFSRAPFSPDGRFVTFSAKVGARQSVYVAPVAGGPVSRLTHEEFAEDRPNWAADGRSILFQSDRGGVSGLYAAPWPPNGSLPGLVFAGGVEGAESPDGALLFVLPHKQSARLMLRSAQDATFRAIAGMPEVAPGLWGVTRQGLYLCYEAVDHTTGTMFMPYDSLRCEPLRSNPANTISPGLLVGFTLDWEAAQLFWCHGRTATTVLLADGFPS